MTAEQFLWTIGSLNISSPKIIEALRLYGEHVAKEVRHKAAEIAISGLTPDEKHRDIMNIKI